MSPVNNDPANSLKVWLICLLPKMDIILLHKQWHCFKHSFAVSRSPPITKPLRHLSQCYTSIVIYEICEIQRLSYLDSDAIYPKIFHKWGKLFLGTVVHRLSAAVSFHTLSTFSKAHLMRRKHATSSCRMRFVAFSGRAKNCMFLW